MRHATIVGILLLTAAGISPAFAGAGNRAGTNGASELLIPVGTRYIGFGSTGVSMATGVEALFWNPAGAARTSSSVGVYFSHMTYLADIGVDYGAVSANAEGIGVFSLGLKSLSMEEIPVTTTLFPDGTGQTFKPQFFSLGLSYSRQLSERVSVGLTGTLISERMADVSANGVAFTVGVIYDQLAGFQGLSFGVAVRNIGPQMRFDGSGLLVQASVAGQNRPPQLYQIQAASFELPSSIEFGLSYMLPMGGESTVLLASAFQSQNFTDDEYKLGVEYSFQDQFFVRGGWDFAQKETAERPYLFGPALGLGVHSTIGALDLTFDYAFRKVDVFDDNHIFSVKLGF